MADIKVSRESSGQQRNQPAQQQGQQQGGGLARRGEFFPSLFSLSPREFFSTDPIRMMRRFTDEMDRMFFGQTGREEASIWAPPIEVRQEGGNLTVCAELPGLNKDDVKVEVTDEGLVIQGERKREQEQREGGVYRSERSYGRFYRLIPLPEQANLEQAHAKFNNGVLEVTVPVPEAQQKRREIPIDTEAKTRTSGGGGA